MIARNDQYNSIHHQLFKYKKYNNSLLALVCVENRDYRFVNRVRVEYMYHLSSSVLNPERTDHHNMPTQVMNPGYMKKYTLLIT